MKHPESIDSGGLFCWFWSHHPPDLEWKLSDGNSSEALELTCSLLWEVIGEHVLSVSVNALWDGGKPYYHHYHCMLFSGLMAK